MVQLSKEPSATPLTLLAELLSPTRRGPLPSKVVVLAPSIQSISSLRREVALLCKTPLVNVEFGTLPTFTNDIVKVGDPEFWRRRISDQELYSLIRVIMCEVAVDYPQWSKISDQEELVSRLAASIADRAWGPPLQHEPESARSTSDLVEVVYSRVLVRLGDKWSFDSQLFARADALIDIEDFSRELRGRYPEIVLYMPHGLVLPAVKFAAKLLSKVDGVVIYGRSGIDEIDIPFEELIPRHYFEEAEVPFQEAFSVSERLKIVDLPDARSEVTYVLQSVVAALENGYDLTEMSIYFSDRTRYLDLLRSSFSEIGITTSLVEERRSSISILSSLIRRISQLDAETVFADVVNLLADLKVGGPRCGEILYAASNRDLVGSPKLFSSNYDSVPPPLKYLSSLMRKLFSFSDNFRAILSFEKKGDRKWHEASKRVIALVSEFQGNNEGTFAIFDELDDAFDPFCNLLWRLSEVDGFVSGEDPSVSSFWTILNSMVEEVDEADLSKIQLLRVQLTTSPPCLTSQVGFFIGLTDDVFPPRPPRSLLEGGMREQLGLLSERKVEALANRSLALSMALCSEVVITVPRVDVVAEKTLHPSGVIASIEGQFLDEGSVERVRFDSTMAMLRSDFIPPMEETMVALLRGDFSEVPPWNLPSPIFSNVSRENSIEVFSDDSDPGISVDEEAFADAISLAPTSVEEWIRCPFGYFARHILKVDRFQNFDLVGSKDPLTRGSFSHDVIEHILKQALTQTTSDDLSVDLEVCFDGKGFVDYPWHTPRLKFSRSVESSRVLRESRWARKFFEDFKRKLGVDPSGDRVDFEVELPPVLFASEGKKVIKLRGRADMVVQRGSEVDSVAAIVDFKTGSSFYYGAGKNGQLTSVQLVLYADMVKVNGRQVDLEYWFFDERRNIERKEVDSQWRGVAKTSATWALRAMAKDEFPRFHHLDEEGKPCNFCYPFGRRDNVAGIAIEEIEALSSAFGEGLSRSDG
ncbi:MAG: PD-(D/E)XK nuclease family protein [Actinomycetota bacterium]|nr:PD-(D/E)XK nuclease family protein [Actinomycetota bacterium]